jgi:hypothetical protein
VTTYDDDKGVWLVPISDSMLNLFAGWWSEPVQLRAVTRDGGESYRMMVRTPAGGDVIDRLVSAAVEQGAADPFTLRNAFEAILCKPT